ncbi:MAG: DUF4230 domain-containing protein [Crocinitomicaceae bacterium]
MRSKIRLLKNLVVLAVIYLAGFYIFRACKGTSNDPDFVLEDTPLHIESVRRIAEVATMSFQDEVVADTVEYFKGSEDKWIGNLKKLSDLEIKHFIRYSNVKRRLTLIVKGEAKVGFELTDKNYRIAQNVDTIWFHFPKAKLLDVNVNPLHTEVFQESGIWNDVARQKLMNKAKTRIVKDVNKAELTQKAEKSMSDLILQLVSDERKILIYYE